MGVKRWAFSRSVRVLLCPAVLSLLLMLTRTRVTLRQVVGAVYVMILATATTVSAV